jgi:hypothetical protein
MRIVRVALPVLACVCVAGLARAQIPAADDAPPPAAVTPQPQEVPPSPAPSASVAAPAEPKVERAGPVEPLLPAEALLETRDESTVGSGGGPRLEFYGFADFNYVNLLAGDDASWEQFVAPKPAFYVGHLNLYMSSALSENWRSLAEVRFTYAPLMDEDPGQGDAFVGKDTLAADYTDVAGSISWSGIEIQRAWIEYQAHDQLTLRAGQWLTPYGYWNDDHGSPTILAMLRPFPINEQLFPERQTGLQAHGKLFIGEWSLAYALTLSNGRGPFSAIRDLDSNKAVGGRLMLETASLGDLSFGFSAYRGRYTASTKRFRVDVSNDESSLVIYRTRDVAYSELSLAVDARWSYHDLIAQAEGMVNDAVYDDDARPAVVGFDPRPAFVADYRRWGGYLLLGYKLPWWELTPYAMGEHTSYTNSDIAPPVTVGTFGLNLRAAPNVVLKGEFKVAHWHNAGSLGLGDKPLRCVGAQIAWAF